MIWQRDELAKQVGQRYEVAAWVTVSQYVQMPWETWLTLSDLTRRAICLEIEQMAQERQRSTQDQEKKLETLMAQGAAGVKFPNQVGSSISRLMS